jgi:aldose 1-epimerase
MESYCIKNKNGLEAHIIEYGARVVRLLVPDRNGKLEDVVLGYDSLEAYQKSNEKYYGATIGRYGNRIGKAQFSLEGKTYNLLKNNGDNSLHGGKKGFHNVFWEAEQLDNSTLELTYFSVEGEDGFPGNVTTKVTYTLTDDNELKVEYSANTDQVTILNLTHHSFFNLSGDLSKTINQHELQILADFYTPVDSQLIPTGEIALVAGTPFDFTQPTLIGKRIEEDNEQLLFGKGYDHNWVLKTDNTDELVLAACISEKDSGRMMEVLTNEPGIQFYGGNFLNGSDIGKNNVPYNYRTAFCLETQHFPDSPNQPAFPSTVLKPGDTYKSICIYRFKTI